MAIFDFLLAYPPFAPFGEVAATAERIIHIDPAVCVEQTDKSKLAIQQSLDKLETLKKALMQKYFG